MNTHKTYIKMWTWYATARSIQHTHTHAHVHERTQSIHHNPNRINSLRKHYAKLHTGLTISIMQTRMACVYVSFIRYTYKQYTIHVINWNNRIRMISYVNICIMNFWFLSWNGLIELDWPIIRIHSANEIFGFHLNWEVMTVPNINNI